MPLSPQENAKIAKYAELLANEPNTLVFAALGSLYARQYNFERAVEVLDSGLQYFPNYFSARVLLAKCYLALNLFEAAIAELEQVIEVDPNNVSALALLGDEYRNRGQTEQARSFYERVLELDPNNEEFQYKLHLTEEMTPGVTEAKLAEDTVLVKDESLPVEKDDPDTGGGGTGELATVTLARIYIDQGLISKAGQILDIIAERDPDNEEATALREQLNLASVEGKITAPTAEKITAAFSEIERIVEDDEFDIDIIDSLLDVSANLKEALSPIIAPRPNGCTSGEKSYELFGIPNKGESGGNDLVLDDSLAEIYMVEFRLPDINVLAGELGIDEIVLTKQFDIEEDEFVIDIEELPSLVSRLSNSKVQKVSSEEAEPDQKGYLDDTAAAVDNDKNKSTQKLQPEDIAIYKPEGLDFEEEKVLENDKNELGIDSSDEVGKQYFEDGTKLLELEDNPFEDENEDFLGWLNSIKLKEI